MGTKETLTAIKRTVGADQLLPLNIIFLFAICNSRSIFIFGALAFCQRAVAIGPSNLSAILIALMSVVLHAEPSLILLMLAVGRLPIWHEMHLKLVPSDTGRHCIA